MYPDGFVDPASDAVDPGDVIYLADGAIRLRVQSVLDSGSEIETAVEVGGSVVSRQGLNIPGSTRGLPAVPEEDLEMLRFGESIGVDLIALSFVRTAEDVTNVRKHTRLPLVAKMPTEVQGDIELFARGGLAILGKIEAQGYNVWQSRPALAWVKRIYREHRGDWARAAHITAALARASKQ